MGHKNCEISNALQLKIKKSQMIKWKYALQYILNNKKQYLSDAENYSNEIIDFLVNLNLYPLLKKKLDKIKSTLNFDNLNLDQKKKIIMELFKMYHCNSKNANLSEFGLGDNVGRMSGNKITSGTIISKSVTGIWESQYEF